MRAGDLIELGAGCPVRCVTWDPEERCWALQRTRRKPRSSDWAVYQVVGPVDDPEVFVEGTVDTAVPLTDPVGAVRAVFGGDVEVVFDGDAIRKGVGELLAQFRDGEPEVFDRPEWRRLDETFRAGGVDRGLVDAARAVVSWCRRVSPQRLQRPGWESLQQQIRDFDTATNT